MSPITTRQHPRFAAELDTQISYGQKRWMATTRDISRGGICLLSDRSIRHGEELELGLSLVFGPEAVSEYLWVAVRVIWCTPVGAYFQMGATFLPMPKEKENYLNMFLRFLAQESHVSEEDDELDMVPLEPTVPTDERFDTGETYKPDSNDE